MNDRDKQTVLDEIQDRATRRTVHQVRGRIGDQIWAGVKDQTLNQHISQIEHDVYRPVWEQFQYQLHRQVWGQIWYPVSKRAWESIQTQRKKTIK